MWGSCKSGPHILYINMPNIDEIDMMFGNRYDRTQISSYRNMQSISINGVFDFTYTVPELGEFKDMPKIEENNNTLKPCIFDEKIYGRVVKDGKVVSSKISYFEYDKSNGNFDIFLGVDKNGKDIFCNDIIESYGQLYQIHYSLERGAYGIAVGPNCYYIYLVCNDINSGILVTDIYNYENFIKNFTLPDDVIKKIRTVKI